MPRLHLVRHGRAAAGWDADPDPDLDDVGRAQAEAVVDRLPPTASAVWSSPLLRCRRTSEPYARQIGATVEVVSEVAEIPSPEGIPMGQRVPWLREAMAGSWADLGDRYTSFRDMLVERLASVETDTVVFSHFVAINAVIGACLGDDRLVIRSLDNTSVTVVETGPSGLVLIEGGHEADTLIR
ncbi:MAG: phosphoglycerate mutase family protein [Actinomycetota bacterium]|jgi:broad specificity phosphatase PhoE|nr:phosphoglycerate mutase family protein [Actinomycetota bacterium]MDA3015144.1 phosphoglycerate mutase family protein [Actinomycetota bacterium]MDA3027418.1 phosphoglycerate mutase family protein [Actinomycetota bacterium]